MIQIGMGLLVGYFTVIAAGSSIVVLLQPGGARLSLFA